jgi:hypothetical protein
MPSGGLELDEFDGRGGEGGSVDEGYRRAPASTRVERKMSLPGFTADAALYKTGEHYRLTSGLIVGVGQQMVMKQQITASSMFSLSPNRPPPPVVQYCFPQQCSTCISASNSGEWYRYCCTFDVCSPPLIELTVPYPRFGPPRLVQCEWQYCGRDDQRA